MARPLPVPDPHRSGITGGYLGRPAANGPLHLHTATVEEPHAPHENLDMLTVHAAETELQQMRSENAQLRALCEELEQALHEATQEVPPDLEKQIGEYEGVLEEKNEMIRQLLQQLQETQAALEEAQKQPPQPAPAARPHSGHAPCEEEMLALSEELERERRQLQEDEQTLMDQMREMEVSMARERAELARQRNDMQRLHNDIKHDLERLERSGAVLGKIEGLRSKLQDVTARRGAAPVPSNTPAAAATPAAAPSKSGGLMGRLFKRGE